MNSNGEVIFVAPAFLYTEQGERGLIQIAEITVGRSDVVNLWGQF